MLAGTQACACQPGALLLSRTPAPGETTDCLKPPSATQNSTPFPYFEAGPLRDGAMPTAPYTPYTHSAPECQYDTQSTSSRAQPRARWSQGNKADSGRWGKESCSQDHLLSPSSLGPLMLLCWVFKSKTLGKSNPTVE